MPQCLQRQAKQGAGSPEPKPSCHQASKADLNHSKAGKDCCDDSRKCEPSGCCCEMKPANPAALSDPSPAVPTTPTFLALPVAIDLPSAPLMGRERSIIFHSDSSPPGVAWHPDFGRAPPVA